MWNCLLYPDATEELLERRRLSLIAACTILRHEDDDLFCTESVSIRECLLASANNQVIRWQYSGTVSLWFYHLISSMAHSLLVYL